MLLTEEDAKTKWCPRQLSEASLGCCLGSSCMAWRWGTPYYTNDVGITKRGFCGLAGVAEPAASYVAHYRGEDAGKRA